VNHFIIIAGVDLLNTHIGMILPMLLSPVTVIVYKQFFDGLPKEFREAAVMDGATELQVFLRVFLPMNWGVTTALAIITFIGAWNSFLWPFLVAQDEKMMTVTVGVSAVQDAYGVAYGRVLAGAVLASLPVALAYLFFQRRVTQAITLSAGIKG
jgi:multiple sugar transport system permease protein